jgi:hypothetical protein
MHVLDHQYGWHLGSGTDSGQIRVGIGTGLTRGGAPHKSGMTVLDSITFELLKTINSR